MGYRRSPDRTAAAEAWSRFVERNAAVIDAAGLPPAATASIVAWDGLLAHGRVDMAPEPFTVDQLTEEQYMAFVELVANYFTAGYEFYTPRALRARDQDLLGARFDRSR